MSLAMLQPFEAVKSALHKPRSAGFAGTPLACCAHGEGTSAATPHQIRRLWRPRRWPARPGRPFEAVVAHPTTQYASPTARGCLRCPDLGDSVRTATGARACANSLAVVLIHRIQPAGVAGAGLNGFRGPRCAPARRDEDGVESALCATVRSIQRSIQ